MFWFGLFLVLVSGLLSINISKNVITKIYPKLNDYRIEKIILFTFLVGLIISTAQYITDTNDNKLLKLKVENFKYSKIAEYNIYGNLSGNVMGVPFKRSPIQDWGKDYIINNDNISFNCKSDSSAINRYFEINKIIPDYPFTYFFIALCYKKSGKKEWENFALRAESILNKTTKIPGHHIHHDVILSQVIELLSE